jgi:hypothetical protein
MMKVGTRTTPLEGARNTLFCATTYEAYMRGQGLFHLPVGKVEHKVDKWFTDRDTTTRLWQQCEAVMARLG